MRSDPRRRGRIDEPGKRRCPESLSSPDPRVADSLPGGTTVGLEGGDDGLDELFGLGKLLGRGLRSKARAPREEREFVVRRLQELAEQEERAIGS